ncbi:4'-phosphopantetheinyl transferase, partial [Bacillus pseudomycoides]
MFNQFSNLISNEKRERIKRLIKLDDVNRILIGDLLVRSLICEKYKINNDEIKFVYNKHR